MTLIQQILFYTQFLNVLSHCDGYLVAKLSPALLRLYGLQSTRLFCPWNFPGKNTEVDCHFLPRGSSWAQTVKNLPAMQETQVRSLGQEDPLEKGKATHSSIFPWRIPWTEEPGGLQSLDHRADARINDNTSLKKDLQQRLVYGNPSVNYQSSFISSYYNCSMMMLELCSVLPIFQELVMRVHSESRRYTQYPKPKRSIESLLRGATMG